MTGLDHGRVKFSGRCTGCAQEHDGLSGCLGQADPEEGPGSLIDLDEDANFGMALQCDGDWRRPRAGRNASELDALCGELIDEGGGE